MIYRKIQLSYHKFFPTGTFRRSCGDFVAICLAKLKLFDLDPDMPASRFDARLETVFTPLSFGCEDNPEVSIIIPVFNKFVFTYTCLKSILTKTDGVRYEVIVLDNASTDKTIELKNIVKNITVVRNEKNLGFVEASNLGAKNARGKYLLFLNNDTKVQDGWLKALVDTAKDERIGIVGGKLIYPNGKLQEAGGIVWNDPVNLAWNFGNGKDPDNYEFNYLKEVDFCSGACLLISKVLFGKTGGFSLEYAPAYCEDVDLAFSVRKLGYKVIYQPKCEVLHFEGATAGTDINQGVKKYQAVNMAKFYRKWQPVLEKEHFKNGENVLLARDRAQGKKTLLFIDHGIPMHDKDSGSLSTYMYLKLLADMGLKVIFAAEDKVYRARYTAELQQAGIEVVYGKVDINAWITENGSYMDYVILTRPFSLKYFANLRAQSKAQIFYNMIDLHYQREMKRYELEKNQLILKEAEKLKAQEHQLFANSDAVLTFSSVEAAYISQNFPDKKAIIIPLFFYDNLNVPEPGELLKRPRNGIVFLGGFSHLPNIDAVEFFLKEIFPLVKQQIPDAKFYVIGSNPPESIQKLCSEDIIVTGYVEDLSEYFDTARVFVAPLRYGAGVKGKIIVSVTFGVPTVITSVANEGLDMKDGVNCMLADKPQDFAEKVIAVYKEDMLWSQLSENAFEYLKENFSKEAAKKKMKEVLGQD